MILRPGIVAAKPAGGGGYTAKAVHFDGSAWLVNAALAATDNAAFALTGWFKFYAGATNSTFLAVAPDGAYTSNGNYQRTTHILSVNAADASGGNVVGVSDLTTPDFQNWFSVVYSVDASLAFGDPNKVKLYVDDVDVTNITSDTAPFTFAFNGLPIWFGNDDSAGGPIMDCADVRIMPGTQLLVAGDIPQATRRLFVSAANKPVDPAIATTALGNPCVLFSGDHSGFPVNQGTGGVFTLTGTLTNASSSPSD